MTKAIVVAIKQRRCSPYKRAK